MTGNLKPEMHNRQLLGPAILLLASITISFLMISILSKGDENVYALSRLKWLPALAGVIFFALFFIFRRFHVHSVYLANRKTLPGRVVLSLLLALIINWFWPFPIPVLPLIESLQIISTGAKNPSAAGAIIEIRSARTLDGTPIPLEKFTLGGDWVIQKERLVSEGRQAGSIATFSGPIPGGVLLALRHNQDAGVLKVVLGEQVWRVDLYAKPGTTFQIPFRLPLWQNAVGAQKWLTGLAVILHVVALAFLVFVFFWISQRRWRFFPILMVFLCGAVFANYLETKLSYVQFNAGRAFRDTYSYVEAAEKSILSRDFWIGKRSFTLPLLYKILDLDTTNFADKEQLNAVWDFQLWFSVISWTSLALCLVSSMRHSLPRLLVFSLVLFFSLTMEVTFWDSLLLSESISFSLFALLLAGWIGIGLLIGRPMPQAYKWLGLVLLAVVTILYSFTRDTNLYFVVAGAGILLLVSLLRLLPAPMDRKFGFAYILFVAVLFLFQNATVQMGNRWQIHIYDHLALRILPDPEAAGYFKEAGLPVSADLLAITGMIGYEYHDYLDFDPRMESVRIWIQEHGRATFLNYLLSHPSKTLIDPLRKIDQILNGSNLEYRYPRYPQQPVPSVPQIITASFYPHQPLILIFIAGLCLTILLIDWRGMVEHRQFFWVLAVLVLSLYPLMVIVWNGNPLEVERHAAQIGIQYRLAGLMALSALLDRVWGQTFGQADVAEMKTVL